MSVRYDPLLTLALAEAIERRWAGTGVRSLAMDPVRRAASLRFADGSALVALFDRRSGTVLGFEEDPLGDEDARITRFGRMTLADVHAPPDERTILLSLAEDDGTRAAGIVLELKTNRWNTLCLSPVRTGAAVDEDAERWRVRYALWTRDVDGRRVGPGEPYEVPASDRRSLDASPSDTEWGAWLAEATAIEDDAAERVASQDEDQPARIPRAAALTTWAWTSALNYEWVFSDPVAALDRYRELHDCRARLLAGEEATFIGSRRWGLQPYPLELSGETTRSNGFFQAMRCALEDQGGPAAMLGNDASRQDEPAADDAELLERRLRKRLDREAKRVAALERQLGAAGPPEAPRELGQILLARKDGVPKGARSVLLQAFDGTQREIALDPALDVVGNAERFFEEARRRERAIEKLPTEIAGARTRLAGFQDALARLERDGPSDDLWRFVGERPPPSRARGKPRVEEERLPYARLRSSGGLEIRVGRGSKDNDALTFKHSAPDDIWLHAAQASGAHVILRWGKREENPPRRDLIEAATAAAVNSQARHSGSVAVVWTRRKYVRKPRKSPPGTVTPERVQTVMVEPDEDLIRRLREPD
ncbi:MAG: NFACT RNA binding domain-containing protein [Gemmatimonadota bacterium]|nr:NFACT RNA binding domain-containing protein [Gemmatimonadota bacterium]